MVPDDGSLADDDAGTVVDREMMPNPGLGMDVDARGGMGVFRKHPRNDPDAEAVQFMGDPVMDHRGDGGVAVDNLLGIAGGRIVSADRFDILGEKLRQERDPFPEKIGLFGAAKAGKRLHGLVDGILVRMRAVLREEGVEQGLHHRPERDPHGFDRNIHR